MAVAARRDYRKDTLRMPAPGTTAEPPPRPTPTEVTESCGDCRFTAFLAFGGEVMVCRRFPPGHTASSAYPQPQVRAIDWCGWYEVGTPFIPAPPAPGCQFVPDIHQDELTLVSSEGEWTGDPVSFTYAWFIADVEDTAQTGNVFTLPPEGPGEAFGKEAYCVVSATNESGTVASPPSDRLLIVKPHVEPVLPVNVDIPHLTQVGAPDAPTAMLDCTMGNWDNVPTGYLYHWFIDGVAQGTTVENTFALTLPAMVGQSATCIVTASNAAGSVDAPLSGPVVILAEIVAGATRSGGKEAAHERGEAKPEREPNKHVEDKDDNDRRRDEGDRQRDAGDRERDEGDRKRDESDRQREAPGNGRPGRPPARRGE